MAEEVALHHRALDFLEELALNVGFNTFGDECDSEGARHCGDGVKNCGRADVASAADIGDERAIDLQGMDLEALEISEGGVAGAEIVDGDGNAELLKPLDLVDGVV